MDLLLLKMAGSASHTRPAWVFLGDVAGLGRVANLPIALSDKRSNVRLVLSVSGRVRMQEIYSHGDAETILTQPRTKIFLRTTETAAAEWVSGIVGTVETRHLCQEDYWTSKKYKKRWVIEEKTAPLVTPATIQGLSDLNGYVKSRDLVVRCRFAPCDPVAGEIPFVPRPLPETKPAPAVEQKQQAVPLRIFD